MLYDYGEKDFVGYLTLKNSDFNILTLEFIDQLCDKLDEIKKKNEIKVLLIQGNSRIFSAGHDLKEINEYSEKDVLKLFRRCEKLMAKMIELPAVVIAKVEGAAVAAGCQLVAACDLAVASTEARFGVPGINSGLFCSTPAVFLSRNIGRKKSLELLFTGNLMDSRQALQYGLVNDVVPLYSLDKTIKNLTDAITKQSRDILALGKHMFYKQLEMPQFEALSYASEVISSNSKHPDALEGIDAFINKRPPKWD